MFEDLQQLILSSMQPFEQLVESLITGAQGKDPVEPSSKRGSGLRGRILLVGFQRLVKRQTRSRTMVSSRSSFAVAGISFCSRRSPCTQHRA